MVSFCFSQCSKNSSLLSSLLPTSRIISNPLTLSHSYKHKREHLPSFPFLSPPCHLLLQANEAAVTINQFVRLTTRGKIAEVVVPRELVGSSMVLVNAAYFKGLWVRPFNITTLEDFYVTPNISQKSEMMMRSGVFRYGML